MDELIKTFHIDWRLMLAQLVNFAIVFFVLWRFALKPLMKMMNERSATIDKSLKDAEAIEQRLVATNAEVLEQIRVAKHQATAIIEQTKKQAEEKRAEMLGKAKLEVEAIVQSAREQIQQEKETMVDDARRELASLVVTGMHKVLGTVLDKKLDEKLVKEQIKNLK